MTSSAALPHKKFGPLSRIIIFPVHLSAAVLYLITSPLGCEKEMSMLFTGGFFSFLIIPLMFYGNLLQFMNRFIFEEMNLMTHIGLPLLLLYFIQVICLDTAHLQPRHAAPIPPRHYIERLAQKFYDASMEYFPITCEPWKAGAKLCPTRQYIFAVHPHAIHCMPLALFTNYGSDFDLKFPNMVGYQCTALAATVIFKIPVVREIFLKMGYVDASRSVASKLLECNRSIVVCVGGEEESMYTTKGKDIVVLKKRKGFIRLALSYGVDIVPVFGSGNSDTYTTYGFMSKQRQWLQKKFGVALPIFHGRRCTPLPYKVPIKTFIGKPIPTPKPKIKGEKPSDELVDKYHTMYIDALKKLHAEHVHDRVLEIM